MNLNGYVDNLHHQLAVAAAAGGDEARALAERLSAPLEASVRLVLLEALSAAADEITRELAPGTVEVRLRGSDPEFVVTLPPTDEDYGASERSAPAVDVASDESGTTRLNFRLPENLKERIERAAGTEGLSLNAWLIRAAHAALGTPGHSQRRTGGGRDHFTGWVR